VRGKDTLCCCLLVHDRLSVVWRGRAHLGRELVSKVERLDQACSTELLYIDAAGQGFRCRGRQTSEQFGAFRFGDRSPGLGVALCGKEFGGGLGERKYVPVVTKNTENVNSCRARNLIAEITISILPGCIFTNTSRPGFLLVWL
jgi:hypothetical protein